MKQHKGKAGIVLLIALITFGVMVLICRAPEILHRRAENKVLSSLPAEIQNPLKKWTKGISTNEEYKQALLDKFNKPNQPHQYGLLAQCLSTAGDFRGAILNLKQGLSIQPSASELHYELGKIFYFLAMFDMVDRGCVVIENKSPDSISITANNYLRYEIDFLLLEHKTLRSFLSEAGLKDERRILQVNLFLRHAESSEVMPAAREALEHARRELGNPRFLPVPCLKPDQRANSILKHALEEIEKGKRGISITRGFQMELIDPIGIKNIEERIRDLIDQVEVNYTLHPPPF
jgi:tetratricopeptide (TPR) repeat protein